MPDPSILLNTLSRIWGNDPYRPPPEQPSMQAYNPTLGDALRNTVAEVFPPNALARQGAGFAIPGTGHSIDVFRALSYLSPPAQKAAGVPMVAAAGALAKRGSEEVAEDFMRVFHGTGAAPFRSFKPERIGTGEGAAAYGHGFYFAESPGVARSYQSKLTSTLPGAPTGSMKYQVEGIPAPTGRSGHAALDTAGEIEQYLYMRKSGHKELAEHLRQRLDEMLPHRLQRNPSGIAGTDIRALHEYWGKVRDVDPAKIGEHLGALYQVQLKVNPKRELLDWDAPLRDQPKAVQKALRGILGEDYRKLLDTKGGEIYQQYLGMTARSGAIRREAEVASQELSQAGIPGIRYLDQGSRLPQGGTGIQVKWNEAGTKPIAVDRSGQVLQEFDSFKEADAWVAKQGDSSRTRNIVLFPGNESRILVERINNIPLEDFERQTGMKLGSIGAALLGAGFGGAVATQQRQREGRSR